MNYGHSAFRTGQKGQPLVVLAIFLSIWIGGRAIMWDSPILLAEAIENSASEFLASHSDDVGTMSAKTAIHGESASPDFQTQPPSSFSPYARAQETVSTRHTPFIWEEQRAPELAPRGETAAAHQLIWLAAMAHLPVPEAIGAITANAERAADPRIDPIEGTDRWSLDAWSYWREGSGTPLVSAGRSPTYGASQTGAVLNYRLAPSNTRDPRLYARAYRALIDQGESELAGGMSLRPIARLPIRAHAEVRLTEFANSIEIRPAIFATTELPQVDLPLDFFGEAYGQAGYVAGEARTAFADGQLHVMRNIKSFDLGSFSIGAAAWGGAQSGAERLDLGPSLRADLLISEVPARLSLDYRERVAGEAQPPSGVAVTLSTRF
ncbi:hypothetical protein BPTFM16_00223 [Altererythrobacter insulae]|nr:hypothetical protein BPTFM16_00223 [Altererythrobacter insulae]